MTIRNDGHFCFYEFKILCYSLGTTLKANNKLLKLKKMQNLTH